MKYLPKNKTQSFILGAALTVVGIASGNYILNRLYKNQMPRIDNYLFNMALTSDENVLYFTDIHKAVKKDQKDEALWLLENILYTKKGEATSLRRASQLTCLTKACKEGVKNLTEASLKSIDNALTQDSK